MTSAPDPAAGPMGPLLGEPPALTGGIEERRRKELIKARLLGPVVSATKIGRFSLLGRIGSGGMGAVYAAYDENLDRRVAIKVLHSTDNLDEYSLRLRREARALARLSHPNVVAVYEVGQWEGQVFVVMEFVAGQTLEAWQRDRDRTQDEVLGLYLEAGKGLLAAHEADLIHRDFKPSNVLVGDDGRVRVADFGLVGTTGGSLLEPRCESGDGGREPAIAEPTTTRTGRVMGTPAYMAPEQYTGAPTDARADQFSFCVALHEALYGRRPFTANTPDVVARGLPAHADAAAGPDTRVPGALFKVLRRGLDIHPANRWPSVKHLLDELARAARPKRSRRRRTLIAGLVVLAMAVSAALFTAKRSDSARAAWERQMDEHSRMARDNQRIARARELLTSDPTTAALILREVEDPRGSADWIEVSRDVLAQPLVTAVERGSDPYPLSLMFLRDGRLVTHHADETIRLWNRGDSRILVRRSQEKIAFAGDRAYVVAGNAEGTVWRARAIDGSGESAGFDTHGNPVVTRQSTSENDEILLRLADGTIYSWRFGDTIAPLRQVELRDDVVQESFSDDGRRLIRWLRSGAVEVWETRGARAATVFGDPTCDTAPHPHTLSGERLSAHHRPAVTRDGGRIALACRDGRILIWRTDGSGPPVILSGHTRRADIVQFSPDGRWLVSSARDDTFRVWNVATGILSTATSGWAPMVRISPDSQRVLMSQRNSRIVRIVELGTGEITALRGHRDLVVDAAFRPNGAQVATLTRGGTVRLWRLHRESDALVLTDHRDDRSAIWSAEFGPDGRSLATAGRDGAARIWRLDRPEVPPVVLRDRESGGLFRVAFSPDGRYLATTASDGAARIWRVDGTGAPIVLRGHQGWAYGVAFSPDGGRLATSSRTGVIYLWNLEGNLEGNLERNLERPGEPRIIGRHRPLGHEAAEVHELSFSHDGRRVAAASKNGSIRLWPVDGSGDAVVIADAHRPASAMFSPDGRQLVTFAGSEATVWSADGARVVRELRGHSGSLYGGVAFGPDNRRLATVSADRTARVWSLEPAPEHGDEPIVLRGHADIVEFVAFDHTGDRLVTGSFDKTVRVWDLLDPRRSMVLRGHTEQIRFVGFTHDGRSVVSASFDGTVRIWHLPDTDVDGLVRQLDQVGSVCLTIDQRMMELGEDKEVAESRAAACRSRAR